MASCDHASRPNAWRNRLADRAIFAPDFGKYSPKGWDCNASHPLNAGKNDDSNWMLHPFGEYLPISRRKPFYNKDFQLLDSDLPVKMGKTTAESPCLHTTCDVQPPRRYDRQKAAVTFCPKGHLDYKPMKVFWLTRFWTGLTGLTG